MGEVSMFDGGLPGHSHSLDIATVEAPIALCTDAGLIQVATEPALALLRRVSMIERAPAPIPAELWRLLERSPQQFLQASVGQGAQLSEDAILSAIAARLSAKKARDFAQSDAIRAELLAAGIVLEDKSDGTTNWRRA